MMRRLLMLLMLLPLVPWGAHAQRSGQPDIVLILTDDMRSGDWRMLPETERLVGGTVFPNLVYATPLCCPTRATLITGQYAHNHGAKTNGIGWDAIAPRRQDSLGPALQEAGYHTAWVGKYLNLADDDAALGWDDWQGSGVGTYEVDGRYSTEVYRERAVAAIAAAPADRPLFLGVSFYAPHNPATPAPADVDCDAGQVRNTLDHDRKCSLVSVDAAVVAIAEAMGSRWDDACVFVLTDNGYMLGEHGAEGKSIWWDQATRVAMRARCPGLGSGTDARLIATTDLLPTILRTAGAAAWWSVDGRPLQEAWSRDAVLLESWTNGSAGQPRNPWFGLKGDGWLYVEEQGHTPRFFADPKEQDTLYPEMPSTDRQFYADWLERLRRCAGASCAKREMEGTP